MQDSQDKKQKLITVFGASWCQPCAQLKISLSKSGVAFDSLDIDENMDIARASNVRSVPTTLIQDGDVTHVVTGNKLKEIMGYINA